MSSTYRERREAKAGRYREWADKREVKADTAAARAEQIMDSIPLGQPILVGHHSEGRHRRDLARIESGMRASIDNRDKADTFRSRADEIERQAGRAIYSDDPDAVEALQARIADLEAERDRIKAYNASCRRGTPNPGLLDDRQRADMAALVRIAWATPEGSPFPAYVLSNLNGNLGRQRKRLAVLTAKAGRAGEVTR